MQDARHAGEARDVRGGNDEPSAFFQNPAAFQKKVHRVAEQMLDQLASQHGFKAAVVVRKAIAFGVEQIHRNLELLTADARNPSIGAAQRPIIRAADLRISTPLLKEWRDLHVTAQFEYSSTGSWARHQCERARQPGQMLLEIFAVLSRLADRARGAARRRHPIQPNAPGPAWDFARATRRFITPAQVSVHPPQRRTDCPQMERAAILRVLIKARYYQLRGVAGLPADNDDQRINSARERRYF